MPGLTKKKKRAYKEPFSGLYDRYGNPNLFVGKENFTAQILHKLRKKPSRKRKGSMETELEKAMRGG